MPNEITRDIECPQCGDILEVTFNPSETDLETDCEDCKIAIPFEYTAATDTLEVLEYEDDEDEPAAIEIEGEEDEEEEEA